MEPHKIGQYVVGCEAPSRKGIALEQWQAVDRFFLDGGAKMGEKVIVADISWGSRNEN